jgi:hypothetical protein
MDLTARQSLGDGRDAMAADFHAGRQDSPGVRARQAVAALRLFAILLALLLRNRSGGGMAHRELQPYRTLDTSLIPGCITGRDRL